MRLFSLISDIGAEGEPGDHAAATDHWTVAAAADLHVSGNIFTCGDNCWSQIVIAHLNLVISGHKHGGLLDGFITNITTVQYCQKIFSGAD